MRRGRSPRDLRDAGRFGADLRSAPRKDARPLLMAVACLLALVVACEVAVGVVGLPVPGSLVALALLFMRFHRRGGPDEPLARIFDGTIHFLPLLFVPAGVGILAEGHLMIGAALSFAVAIIGGTLLTMVAVGHVMQAAMRVLERPGSRSRAGTA